VFSFESKSFSGSRRHDAFRAAATEMVVCDKMVYTRND
jgi:hypothetical protein